MKTNIKMRVTPEQSKRVQEICFKNNITWNSLEESKIVHNLECSCLYIGAIHISHAFSNNDYFNLHLSQEIDADLFIRTNGTCEENTFNELFEKVSERVNDFQIGNRIEPLDKYRELEQKLQKKNEILKKARIKRKNQREELHKLNIKLQKCIDFEAHNIATQKLRDTIVSLRDDVIKKVDNMRDTKNKEIENLKAVNEYLWGKVKC